MPLMIQRMIYLFRFLTTELAEETQRKHKENRGKQILIEEEENFHKAG